MIHKFIVNTKLYPLEALLATSYLFIEKAYIILQSKGKDIVEVKFTEKKGGEIKDIEELKGEFYNELLNNALRLSVAKRNKIIRQCIVHKALFSAFSGSETLAPDTTADYNDDPLGIAIPWEEKNK